MTVTDATEASDRMPWSFNMLMDVKASAEETGGALTVIDSWLTPAANPPMHVHHTSDEAFYVLEGEVDFFPYASCAVRPGDFVFGPRGAAHRFEIRTSVTPLLVIGTPGGGERFFAAVGEPAGAAQLPTPREPDVARVVTIAAAHDIEILPPPA